MTISPLVRLTPASVSTTSAPSCLYPEDSVGRGASRTLDLSTVLFLLDIEPDTFLSAPVPPRHSFLGVHKSSARPLVILLGSAKCQAPGPLLYSSLRFSMAYLIILSKDYNMLFTWRPNLSLVRDSLMTHH